MRSAFTRNSCRIVKSIWPQKTTKLPSLPATMPCQVLSEVANLWTKITTQSILLARMRDKIRRQCRLGEEEVLEKCSTRQSRRYIMCPSRPNSKNLWANQCLQTHSWTKKVILWCTRGRIISSQNRLEDSWLWVDQRKNLWFQVWTR